MAMTARTRPGSDRAGGKLTVADICRDLGISPRTFYEWRAKGKAPKCIPLPNGALRVEPTEYRRWLDALAKGAA